MVTEQRLSRSGVRREIPGLGAAVAAEEDSARHRGALGVSCGGELTVVLHNSDDVLLVRLFGPVGPESRRGLYSALNAAFISRPIRMVIGAADITDCDRRGLAAFVDAVDRASNSEIPLAMYGLRPDRQKLLTQLWRPAVTTGLCHPTLQSAWAAVKSVPTAEDPTHDELLDDVRHLHDVLSHGRIVEQATGVLMATYGITAQAALDLLRTYSAAQNVSLRVLASRVTAVVHRRPTGRQMDALLGAPSRAT